MNHQSNFTLDEIINLNPELEFLQPFIERMLKEKQDD